MFTGIVEEVGRIASVVNSGRAAKLTIHAEKIMQDMNQGDSIAVNGICLTVISFSGKDFTVDVMQETLSRTSLSRLKYGSLVNLERAMPLNGRFGGHIVTGHIDGTGTIVKICRDSIAVWYTIKTNPDIIRYIVEKGSVAVDGISLTVAELSGRNFSVSVIPHTIQNTILSSKAVNGIVNLENDCIGKYVERFVKSDKKQASAITGEFIAGCGY